MKEIKPPTRITINVMRPHLFLYAVLVSAGISLLPEASYAQADRSFIENVKLCTHALRNYEEKYKMPPKLLTAISITETGRYHKGLNLSLPWPWTINVEGKGYYYDSKEDAIAAVQTFQARGIRSIDVGCMQVNLMYHAKAFSSLQEAFTPENNIDYAARFLLDLYKEGNKDWDFAAASYHSKTKERGLGYLKKVSSQRTRVLQKIQSATQYMASLPIYVPQTSEEIHSSEKKQVMPSAGSPSTSQSNSLITKIMAWWVQLTSINFSPSVFAQSAPSLLIAQNEEAR